MSTRGIAEQIVANLDWTSLNSLAPRELADTIDAALTKAIQDEREHNARICGDLVTFTEDHGGQEPCKWCEALETAAKRIRRDSTAEEEAEETSTAYNADEMIRLHLELLGTVEHERLEKSLPWVRSTVNGLIQRVYNLRKMVAERDEAMRGLTSTQNEYGGRLRLDGGKENDGSQ